MKKTLFSIIIIIISLGSTPAQTFSGKLNPSPAQNPVILNSSDTLKILCALVEFQEDKFDQTYGNGKFGSIYTKDYGNEILDPLPHDVNYFSNHMKFAQNYFRKVSKGRANISYDFLPEIITVTQPMRDYSPSQNSETFSELGNLAQEVWQNADQRFSNVNFSDYDLFLIFHAGVGRDIVEVTLDFGRYDLPSIYLSSAQLKKIFGNDFEGFQVQNGNFKINNTAILPETENREVEGIGQTVLLELTTNGLIVSTIASHLGLPDLFNTETGSTAIGRFGLMDGQSLFAYSGLFPPEPSPWEKIYLNWEVPVTVQPGNYNITLTANLSASVGDTTILKVPINSSEYYLIENRKRDAHKDGAIITSILNGQTKTQTFAQDDTAGFNPYNIELIDGVVTDVDEYDWAVPGFEDEQLLTDPFEDVGIVIWHIDESIINANIADNKINADQNNKGVKIVEADGIVDIGEEFTNIFGEIIVGDGTRQDTWYEENPSKYYENKFTPDTKPNTNSNTGGSSLINFEDFSTVGNKMSFKLSYSSEYVNLNFSEKLNITDKPSLVKSIISNDTIFTFIKLGNNLRSLKANSIFSDFENVIVNDFMLFEKQNNLFAAYPSGKTLQMIVRKNNSFENAGIEYDDNITSPVSASFNSDGSIDIYSGNLLGIVNKVTLTSTGGLENLSQNILNVFSNEPVKQIAVNEGVFAASSNNKLYDANGNIISFPYEIIKHVLTQDKNGSYVSIVLTNDNLISFVKDGAIENSFLFSTENSITTFSVGDFFEDGNNYIVINNGNKVEAYNFAGALVDGFPFMNSNKTNFTGTPSIVDINNDGSVDIVVATEDGKILAFTPSSNKLVDGLNLSTGAKINASPYIYEDENNFGISVVNDDNYFFNWNYKSSKGRLLWTGDFADNLNSSYAKPAKLTYTFDEYFPEDKVYNWPNPVYEGETNIRFYVSEDSKVNVKIFDLAGDFVAELSSNATGGLYNEIQWNVNDISSGVYFARVEATGNSGASANKIIKIAVIK